MVVGASRTEQPGEGANRTEPTVCACACACAFPPISTRAIVFDRNGTQPGGGGTLHCVSCETAKIHRLIPPSLSFVLQEDMTYGLHVDNSLAKATCIEEYRNLMNTLLHGEKRHLMSLTPCLKRWKYKVLICFAKSASDPGLSQPFLLKQPNYFTKPTT